MGIESFKVSSFSETKMSLNGFRFIQSAKKGPRSLDNPFRDFKIVKGRLLLSFGQFKDCAALFKIVCLKQNT